MRNILRFAGVAALCLGAGACTHTRIYHSVHWLGRLDVYPARACVEPAITAVPGYESYSWGGKLMLVRVEPKPRNQEDRYEVSTKSMTLDLWIARADKGQSVLELTYFRPENPAMTAAGNALLSDIGARCNIPELLQHMRYEYRKEPHGVPFWTD